MGQPSIIVAADEQQDIQISTAKGGKKYHPAHILCSCADNAEPKMPGLENAFAIKDVQVHHLNARFINHQRPSNNRFAA